MLYYVDTSALVKLYVEEQGTDSMIALTGRERQNEFGLLSLSSVEFRCAIRRRQQARDIDDTTASDILGLFQLHLEDRFITQPLTEALIDTAVGLVDRHILRAYDAIQLSGCLALASTRAECTFACSDASLLKAASSEGLPVFDPTA